MDDERDEEGQERRPPRAPGEGVRIIGAEEAQQRLESGEAAQRRPEDAPRFGDRPATPEGPRPQHRFPLPESVEPEEIERPPVTPPPPPTEMPHWTEPPTGEVPKIFADVAPEGSGDEEEDDFGVWSSLSRQPRWRDQASDWDETDFDDASVFADDETRLGALDTSRAEHSDLFSFEDEPVTEPQPRATAAPIRTGRPLSGGPLTPPEPPTPPGPRMRRPHMPGGGGGRDVQTAIATGIGVGILALVCFKIGRLPTFALALVVVTLAAVEVFDVLRRAGYHPATLLGIFGTVSLMLATYTKGETAIPMVLVLMTIFTFLWYLWGVVSTRPTINVAVTLAAFLWVSFLGAFAALMLALPNSEGVALLLPCVIATVASDVGGYIVGSQIGNRPLAPEISPNKTLEGMIGGLVASVVATTVIIGITGMHLNAAFHWDAAKAFWEGLIVGVFAPVGDLCQSMIKRDLGIKDMGTLLPSHGGILDRFDGLLFALPATYYLARLLFS